MSRNAVRFGVAGLGGFAKFVTERLIGEAQSRQPAAELVAVCDPRAAQFVDRTQQLAQRGTQIFDSFDELLAADIEAVWLPLPIDLHRQYTEKALAAGKAVLCEKPA